MENYMWMKVDCGNGMHFDYWVMKRGRSLISGRMLYSTLIRTDYNVLFRSLPKITNFLPWLENVGAEYEDVWEDRYRYTLSMPHYYDSREDDEHSEDI